MGWRAIYSNTTYYRIIIKGNIWYIEDYTIFRLYYGSLSINGIEMAAKLQIVWYGCTFIWGVPRDPKHHYFVFLDTKIRVKTLLPMYLQFHGGMIKMLVLNLLSLMLFWFHFYVYL